jgi:HK97 family phage portal protein
MAFWRRKEKRDITEVPWDVGAPLSQPVTQDRALALAPVYAASRHLADLVSTLPLQAYRRGVETREPMSAMPQLFRLLADEGDLGDWLFTATTSLTLRGNAVGLITSRDGFGYPTSVTWVPMDSIYVDDSTFPRAQWYYNGRKINREEIVHVPWFKIAGRTLGLSPIEAFALTITSGLEAQKFGNDWFEAGGVPPGTFKNSEATVDQAQADIIKARLVTAIRSRKPIVYGKDWEYSPVTIPPEQAQFIETMKLSANQIAAIYGIAPEEVGGEASNSLTYSNEEHRQRRRLADARPWLVRFETKFSSWIPEVQYVRFNLDAPIRVDVMTRTQVFEIERRIGLASIDEQRALTDRPPLPNGAGKDYTPLATKAAAAAPAMRAIPGEVLLPSRSNGDRHDPVLVDY